MQLNEHAPRSDTRTMSFGAVSLTATCLQMGSFRKIGHNSGNEGAPLGQCGRAAFFVSLTVGEVAFLIEMVVERGLD